MKNFNIFGAHRNITRKRYEIGSNVTIKTPQRRQWRRSGIFIVNLEHISSTCIVTLNK